MDKKCCRCKLLKPIAEFRLNANGTTRDGRASECRLCHNAEVSAYNKRHRKEIAIKGAMWAMNNKEKVRKSNRDYKKKRRLERRPEDLIDHNIRELIRKQITKGKKSKRTFESLGYTREELMAHLEKKFKPGMTWWNYGQWHIDHIIPKLVFNVVSYDDLDFKRCWALNNLQPLWAIENMKKRDKLTQSFQPSLSLGVAS